MDAKALKSKIAGLPLAPGVYFFKDSRGQVIYIGKAKALKIRVESYFSRQLDVKTQSMVSRIADLEYRLTGSENQALFLEARLVRRYQPKYNISLRDDKSFPFVKITQEEFPLICVSRKREPDGATYLGPYTSAKLLRSALRIIRRSFPFRSCKNMPQQACMYYRLGLSPAPCIGKITRQEYAKTVENIRLILEGKSVTLIKRLAKLMAKKARNLEFEDAGQIRDQIDALGALGGRANIFSREDESKELANLLGLKKSLQRIEAIDISNISGKEAAGSLVSFFQGSPDKNNYRRFRIKTVSRIDDYGMLREVVRRRYARLTSDGIAKPDLILIDGGKGHLAAAALEIKRLGIKIPLISLAKQEENIYCLHNQQPLNLSEGSAALNLIRRIRDEAHRFALAYHHILRRKKTIGR